ncbi:pantetheine-phosphate adenylyltransferase [Candidatus Gracilibacteria bacterium]|nr:pantetheine-phosphate adenylyltransferase [Candidatus Gracilibacteria bacterium]
MKIALYPGSFDPVTYGHLDTAKRATRIFDRVIMAVFDRPSKNLLFSTSERLELLQTSIETTARLEATSYAKLTIDYAREVGAVAIVRGLRAAGDFEHEFQIAQANQYLDSSIEMVILMASRQFSFLSSSVVREIAAFGGDVGELVPPQVATALQRKYAVPRS